MEEVIIDILESITNEKVAKNIHPSNPVIEEVRVELEQRMRDTLNSLFKQGRISVGNTINSKYIKLLK